MTTAAIKVNTLTIRQKYKRKVILLILLEFIEISKLFQTSTEGLIFIITVFIVNQKIIFDYYITNYTINKQ